MTHQDTDLSMNGSAKGMNSPVNEPVETAPEVEVADTNREVADTNREVADTNRPATAIGRTDSAPELVDTNKTTMDSEANLLPTNEVERYREEWRVVQAGFVDDPQAAVRDADRLLEQVVDTFTSRLAERRTELSGDNGDANETEHLRQALRSYRSLFDQLIGA